MFDFRMSDEQRRRENIQKYFAPPSPELIMKVVKKFGVPVFHFETFFGIPKRTIHIVCTGRCNMPVKYWHIFYDPPTMKEVMDYKRRATKKQPIKEQNKKPGRPKMIDPESRIGQLLG